MKYPVQFQDSENNTLRGIVSIVENDKTKLIIILAHGFSIDKETSPMPEFEDLLNKKGISTLRFDFYGHGESDGLFEDITITKGVGCIMHAINYLHSEGFQHIGLLGESFGGQCSILSASQTNKLEVLCLKSAVSDYAEVEKLRRTSEVLEKWKETNILHFTNGFGKDCKLKFSFEEDITHHDAYLAAENILIPTFVAHGEDDKIVPPTQSEKLSLILPKGELHIYPRTKHHYDDREQFNKFLEESTDFIVKVCTR